MWIATLVERKQKAYSGISWARTLLLKCDSCEKDFERDWMGPKIRASIEHYCSKSCAAHVKNLERWSSVEARSRQSETLTAVHADPEKHGRIMSGLAAVGRVQTFTHYVCGYCGTGCARADRRRKGGAEYRFCSPRCARILQNRPVLSDEQRATLSAFLSAKAIAWWETDGNRERGVRANIASQPARFATMKKNGTDISSRVEREFIECLRMVFGSSDVVHHPPKFGWCHLDAYIDSIATYVEFDGVYYHGLDRPYEELSQHVKRKFDRDRSTDAWFRRNGLRLVRVREDDWKVAVKSNTWRELIDRQVIGNVIRAAA